MFLLQFVKNFVVYLWGGFLVFLMASPKYIYDTSVRSKKLEKKTTMHWSEVKKTMIRTLPFPSLEHKKGYQLPTTPSKLKVFNETLMKCLPPSFVKKLLYVDQIYSPSL